ncbi:baseplate J/gp47 family protein [Roseomonas nepalensis]|uniref:Baseplate J/gp47 family protein n=1 Tax=Muricoccus nepalensis TaxID=1854500 RepID=A0A502FUI4_9PROT|nr:baseplate J/gp47 family protein [Roseomonas nepalensis]TPG53277.1 baseplate J/gp47 family protein [Roseomonas nepalensis]
MPFARPSLTALIQQVLADLAQASGVPAVLRWRPDYAMGIAIAGLTQGLYGYLDWIARQAVPATSTGEFRAAWAALKGVFPKDATLTKGRGTFPGAPGALLPVGSAVRRADGSAAYVTTADAAVGLNGSVTVPLQASAAGPAGNGPAGTALLLSPAVPGVTSAGLAEGPLTGGTDAEDIDSDGFLTRMLLAYAEPAQGGAARDYLDWALAVPGVTRAWIQPNGMGAGTVIVRFMMDETNPGGFPVGSNGVASDEPRAAPATGDQLAVANAIFPDQPVTALVYAVVPTPQPIDFSIGNLSQDSAATRAEIRTALAAMLRAKGEPDGTIFPSDTSGAVDAVFGVSRFTILAPTGPVEIGTGSLPVLGTVTFVS